MHRRRLHPRRQWPARHIIHTCIDDRHPLDRICLLCRLLSCNSVTNDTASANTDAHTGAHTNTSTDANTSTNANTSVFPIQILVHHGGRW